MTFITRLKKRFLKVMRRIDPNHSRTFWCSVRGSYYLPSAYEVEVEPGIAMKCLISTSFTIPNKLFYGTKLKY